MSTFGDIDMNSQNITRKFKIFNSKLFYLLFILFTPFAYSQNSTSWWGHCCDDRRYHTPEDVCKSRTSPKNSHFSHAEILYNDQGVNLRGRYASCFWSDDDGNLVSSGSAHLVEEFCPLGYTPNGNSANGNNTCSAYCPVSHWNGTTCQSTQNQQTCGTSSTNPIDFFEGEKYRDELLLKIGTVFPIDFRYFYNSQRGAEENGNGLVGCIYPNTRFAVSMVVIDTVPIMNANEFAVYRHSDAIVSYMSNSRNFSHTYWRHNYDQWLSTKSNGKVAWYRQSGRPVIFDVDNRSSAFPFLVLADLSNGEKSITDQSEGRVYTFNAAGNLREIKDRLTGQYHTIIYEENSHYISQIHHSLGGHLALTYQSNIINPSGLVSISDTFSYRYVTRVMSHDGRRVDIQWEQNKKGCTKTDYLITQITHPYKTVKKGHRDYEYSDLSFPFALTAIYDQDTDDAVTRRLYAEFTFDDQMRATQSQLANSAESITVDYVNENIRKVTNALGKEATYTFGIDNGARRLLSVTGEPTQNCLQSDTSFTYYSNGSTQTKTVNGVTTAYQYNDRGLETQRIEAQGTPEQKTITTEWHPTFTLPTKITQGNRVTIMTYDDQGRLQNQTEQPLTMH